MAQLRPCPVCKGRLRLERDTYGLRVVCFMCGRHWDLSDYQAPPHKTRNDEPKGPPALGKGKDFSEREYA